MDRSSAKCPKWLASRIADQGGTISFHSFMDWALNDPLHGAYGAGKLNIGEKGDFVTSPSLSSDFAELLSIQIASWFKQLSKSKFYKGKLYLIEIGPGEGSLGHEILISLEKLIPNLISKIDLILVERNKGMIDKQKRKLIKASKYNISWVTAEDLKKHPKYGIIIANEVLDALPVERIIYKDNQLYRQGVSLTKHIEQDSIEFCELKLTRKLSQCLEDLSANLNIDLPPQNLRDGWTTELHVELDPWFQDSSEILSAGILLIIDYALEAVRYYNEKRIDGTILSYKNQSANYNPLTQAGSQDITSHLCLETIRYYSEKHNLNFLGEVRQGQALLALGLASKLSLIKQDLKNNLESALRKREALLRLVDPVCLGDFRWIALEKSFGSGYIKHENKIHTKFLDEPIKED